MTERLPIPTVLEIIQRTGSPELAAAVKADIAISSVFSAKAIADLAREIDRKILSGEIEGAIDRNENGPPASQEEIRRIAKVYDVPPESIVGYDSNDLSGRAKIEVIEEQKELFEHKSKELHK